jgi:tetratricopeptide (TPR) repeat protein
MAAFQHLKFASSLTLQRGSSAMFWKRWMVVGMTSAILAWAPVAHAKDVKITLPRRSHLTAVQRLNQEGVQEIHKHRYEKAENLFYKAYLLDPDDPFTLNNLGYVAELQGQVDRAQRFYELASEQATDAVIYRASSPTVEGRTMKQALAIPDMPLQVNHQNVEAVRLLSQGRAPEADILLQKVLKDNPRNIFTLNNMGVAKEMEGESEAALKYYDDAAATPSDAAAVVTLNRSWRGKPVCEMAAQNAKNLRTRLEARRTPEERVAELNIRGVSDINRNDLAAAVQAFRNAYSLDPNNVFALNNIGYLSEIEGDRETAQFFYDKAQALVGPKTTVGLATRRSAEGMKLSQVAADSESKVDAKVSQERAALRRQGEPLLLRRRDNSIVQEPSTPPANSVPQR